MMDGVLLKIEKFFAAIVAFIVFMTKNLLISAAFLGSFMLVFPTQFSATLEFFRPVKIDSFHDTTQKVLMGNRPRKKQVLAEGGTDLAEIGFSADGHALQVEKKDYAALYEVSERRVAGLEAEVAHLRGELRKTNVKPQHAGAEVPTAEPAKSKWNFKSMLGITPKEESSAK